MYNENKTGLRTQERVIEAEEQAPILTAKHL